MTTIWPGTIWPGAGGASVSTEAPATTTIAPSTICGSGGSSGQRWDGVTISMRAA